jgi:cyclopropane fatty-acyl-phospholipid synthase-like methyltransferase
MSDRPSGTAAVARKPLLARVKSWFGPGKAPKPATAASAVQSRGKTAADAPAVAPLSRLTVAQWLWGDGFVSPGDAEYVLDFVKPLGLSPAASLLDLSAGLGGPARVIAQAFGTYVTGLERSPERAKRGMEMSAAANLGKKATVAAYDPETLELRANSFDCIIGRGATYNVVEKERLFRVAHHGLKQRGQLLFNEFMMDPTAGERPELAAWKAKESYPPRLWTLDQYTDCLSSLGFDIRITTDLTGAYRSMITTRWARMLEEIDLKAMAKQHRLTVIDEAELWVRRIGAIENGGLRVYRVYALLNKPSR